MSPIRLSAVLVAGALAVALGMSDGAVAQKPAAEKDKAKAPEKGKAAIPEGYNRVEIGLFVLYVHDDVLAENRKSTLPVKPMKALTQELNILYTQLGESVLKRVQRDVKIWVEWSLEDPKIPKGAIAYYYSKDPRGKSVVITRTDIITKDHQPGNPLPVRVLLHEMAHAVHDVHPDWDEKIQATYNQAMERKLYHFRIGDQLMPYYAATSHHEYFAELTCAYLAKLRYPPHTRADLAKYDEAGFKLMESFWNKVKSERVPPPDAKPAEPGTAKPSGERDLEKEAARKLELIKSRINAGRTDAAKEKLEELIKEYPQTEAAKEAVELLQALSKK